MTELSLQFLICGHVFVFTNGLSILTGSPQQAVLGENVNITLKCVVDVDNTVVNWKKDEKTVGSISIDSSGDCTGMPPDSPYIFLCDQISRTYYIIIQIRNLPESEKLVAWKCRRLFDVTSSDFWSISIAVPVTTVTITPAGINNVVNVLVGDTRTFSCSTDSSRPAAWIHWYIGGENVTNQAQPQTPQPDGDNFISSSRLVYTGKNEDHTKNIHCEAFNIKGRDKVKSTEISIYVELPVTSVTITPAGINNMNNVVTIKVGETHTFVCSTGSSRPAAWIQWYIGEENVTNQAQPQTTQPDGDKFISYSRLVYTGKDEDHNKTLYCEAVNIEGRDKVKSTEITIYIQIPVTTVTITPAGINNVVNVLVGDTRTFSCSTDLSRPAAWIQWYIGGENVTNQAQPQTPQPDGDKFISSSILVFTGKDEDHNKTIYCEAVNIEGRDGVRSTEILIYIQKPVTTVTITPRRDSNLISVIDGDSQSFSCTTDLSRPAAWIQWYIGGENVTIQAQPQTPQPDGDKFVSSSTMVYTGKDADHKKSFYCEAVNIEGRDKVKSKETSIYIQIPLTTVTITPAGINNSAEVVVGDTRTFNCSTGLSRPAAWIQWYIGGDNVTNQAQPQTPQPDGDKFISSSTMMYTGKDEDHNNNIYCEAVNIEDRDKVKSIEITLYLELPPTALTITPLADNNIISMMKGDTETFNCTTNSCRPASRIHWYIGTLNVTIHAQQQTQQLDGDKFVSSSRLVYQGKDDDHNKTIYCEAVSVEGKYKVKSRKQFIFIFREPIPPSYIYVVCKSTTAIVILKLIENGMGADDLYIQYTVGGQNMTSIKLHIIDIMNHIEYTVTGLYPGKHYNFSIMASNPFGETSSNQVECDTDTLSFGQDIHSRKEDNSGMFSAGIASLVIGLLLSVACTIFFFRKIFKKTYIKSSRSDEYSDLQASNPAFQDPYTSIHPPIESRHYQESSANTYEECGNAVDAAAYQHIENKKSGHKKEEKNLGIYDNMKI